MKPPQLEFPLQSHPVLIKKDTLDSTKTGSTATRSWRWETPDTLNDLCTFIPSPGCISLLPDKKNVLTLSLPWCDLKKTDENTKYEILKPFYVLALASERTSVKLKTHRIKSRFVWQRTGKYTVCWHVHAFFSLEFLWAPVRGLIFSIRLMCTR